jgi:2-dehydro-3-deoxygluconokinase
MPYDVVSFGEAMVRLSPPGHRRLEQTDTLDVFVGGAELNTAVGLVRLGRSTAWVSRLRQNPLGRLLVDHVRRAGVSSEHVLWTDEGRVGTYYVEFGAAPRPSSVLYDRKDSAFSRLRPDMFDWKTIFAGARWFHITGITPALSPSAAQATREAIRAAKAAGVHVSIDLNYRAKLWTAPEAAACMGELLQYCDVLVSTEEDLERVFGLRARDMAELAAQASRHFAIGTVAITVRENPLVWRNTWTAIAAHAGEVLRTKAYDVEIVDRLGAGDAFAAGLIHGLLDGDLQKALDYGVAASALKHSIPGDFNLAGADEVEAVLQGQGLRISR